MDSDEDQQALAWQQIIRNRAFDNVRVQRGESWVDAACRTLDELIDQKEQAEKSLAEFLASQLTSRDDKFTQLDEARIEANIQRNRAIRERDAAVARAKAAEARTAPAVTREDVEAALAQGYRMAFGMPVVSIEMALETVCDLFGVETKQAVDPIEAKARELFDVANADVLIEWERTSEGMRGQYRRLAAHILGQENRHVDE